MRFPVALVMAAIVLASPARAAELSVPFEDRLGLVPLPASVVEQPGEFRPGTATTVTVDGGENEELDDLGGLAVSILEEAWAMPVTLQRKTGAPATLRLQLQSDPGANPESYRLQVAPDGIQLRAPTAAGLFYGLQTLRQLAPPGSRGNAIPALVIEDAPRFGYRGLHLDVARHLFPMDVLKRHLDLMARYKFNTFHWHLTDDQGWRLEIKRYPRLTEVGAWRKETLKGDYEVDAFVGDGIPYGGFYTQQQARELVAYARKLHIQVIPEIDMPGHMVAALAAYPELACTPGPFEVRKTWGVADDILCPSEQTFAFVEGVLTEVMEIFPSRYIHLGGDEAPTTRWENSTLAQSIIEREGLKDEHALQGWFMRRVEKFINAHGRSMIGWDEILDGEPQRSATVMSWRGMAGGIKAAQLGHDVIMSPTDYAYLDYCQGAADKEPKCIGGYTPLSKTYAFEPVPDTLTAAEARHILGPQGNLWTEYLKTPAAMEYMAWPRAFAISEVAWSPRDARDWNGFIARLGPQFDTLQALGVNYRIPEVVGLEQDQAIPDAEARVILASPMRDASIVYTLDGSEPDASSPRYAGPFVLPLSASERSVSARLLLADGRLGPVASARYLRGEPRKAIRSDGKGLKPGLARRYFEDTFRHTDRVDALAPARSDASTWVGIPEYARKQQFGLYYEGFLEIPADGLYRFLLDADDGARLQIGDQVVIDRNGQPPGESEGSIALAKGLHAFVLRYYQADGERKLLLRTSQASEPPREIAAARWWHQP